jgi:hypothetical protein
MGLGSVDVRDALYQYRRYIKPSRGPSPEISNYAGTVDVAVYFASPTDVTLPLVGPCRCASVLPFDLQLRGRADVE